MSDDMKGSEDQQKSAEQVSEKQPVQAKVWSDDEVKKIIEERDNAKRKLRKIDEDTQKAAESKAIEEGKLKEVLEKQTAELESLRKFKESKDVEEIAVRESALTKLSDEDKEIAKELSTPKLLAYVEKQTKQPPPFNGKGKPTEAPNPLAALPGETYQAWQRRIESAKAGRK